MIDDEVKSCAWTALRNAFTRDLQQLVNTYTAAGAQLDDLCLAELHTFPDDSGSAVSLNIHVDWAAPNSPFGPNHRASCGHATVIDALQDERGERLYIAGTLMFERLDGEWEYVENL